MGTPPSASEPVPKAIFTSSVLVHDKVPPSTLSHAYTRVVNVSLPKQSEIQTPSSMAYDPSPTKQGGSEAVPPVTTSTATTSTQSEVALTVPVLLQALMDVSAQFDDRLKAMQTEVHALRTQNAEELKDLKEMVVRLTAEVSMMRKGKEVAAGSQIQGEKTTVATTIESEIPKQSLKRKREEGDKRYYKTTRFNTKTGQSEVFYETDWSLSSDESEKEDVKGKGKVGYTSDQDQNEEEENMEVQPDFETEEKKKQDEAERLAKLQRYAHNFGMTVEQYREYVKGLYKEKFDFNPYDQSAKAAEEFEAEIQVEEDLAIEEEQMRVEADKQMAKQVHREEARVDYIERNFILRKHKNRIQHLECTNPGRTDLLLTCYYKGGSYKIGLSMIHTLGLEEWKDIARLSTGITNVEHSMAIKREAIYNVNAAYMLKLINDEEFRAFCTMHKVRAGAKSLGLETSNMHPVPKGVVFQDRTYVETEKYAGLCYVDCGGEESFQAKDRLNMASIYHCIALLSECESAQCLPFRMKLISWLFNNLRRIEEIGTLADKVELIKKEYQVHFHKSDAEMKRLLDWKTERLKWLNEANQPVPFETSLKKKKRTLKKKQ